MVKYENNKRSMAVPFYCADAWKQEYIPTEQLLLGIFKNTVDTYMDR